MVLSASKFFAFLIIAGLLNCTVHAGISTDSTKWNKKYMVNSDTIYATAIADSVDSENEIAKSLNLFHEDGLITPSNDDSIRAIIDRATAIFSKIESSKNFITNLNNVIGFELPVGISKNIGGLTYAIGIDAIRLKPSFAEIDVYMQFEVPQNGKKLTFMARGIKFSRNGGIIGDATLALVGDYAINFNGDKGQLVIKGAKGGSGGTFVRMDCDGFREMGLDAELRFSRDLLLPEDANGAVKDGNVAAAFQSVITNWNDLLVQITLPHFQVAGLAGFGFALDDAVFDFSDTRNAPSVIFPKGYSIETDPSLTSLWRGVYVRQLSVRLPSHFKNKQNTSTTFAATDLLIDHQGVSGMFEGKNLIPLNNGDMSGWAFSVDSLAVSLMANQIQSAGLKGSIVVPISDERTPFKYVASFGANNQYLFDITPTKDLQFDMFQTSKVEIYKGSSIEITIDNGRFLPMAILNGKMDINAKLSEGGQGVSLADIKFENLQIQTVRPYLQVGNFSFGSEALQHAMAGFPISIDNIGMTNATPDQASLNFDLKLNLVGEKSGGFAADAGLSIVAQMNASDGSQSWSFKEIQVRDIDIDIDGGEAFKFKGSLTFYRQDAVYGDGFNGSIDATFISKLTLKANAIFGSVKGERYWYADALVKFATGIPFFSGVGFYGFGGGAFYRMKMDVSGNPSPLGKTASGTSYVPALENGLGLKAIVYLGSMPSEKAFTADVTFEIAFFKSGGIHTISMTGNAFIATPDGLASSLDKLKSTVGNMRANLPKLEQALNSRAVQTASKITATEIANVKLIQGDIGDAAGDKGGISAHVYICYDFENRTLHGNFDTQIDIAKVITGGGDAVLHFSPQEWYVYVGTPDQRFSISIGIGPIRATSSSYFMVGTTIPGSPPPPPEVSQILGGKDLDYMKDLNAIGNGAGFAFGAAMSIKTGDLTFLIFYANFSAGAGFDIMVKNYGNTYCEGSSSRIGINGWYANGQAYAYFTGDIGIKVKLFWSTKHVKILSIGAAALLQAKLPNPIWLHGEVGGYFSVLGGLVSGQCDFQVTLGNDCKIVTKSNDDELSNIQVISQLTPGVGETQVNVFNNPQAVFNLAVNKQFEMSDDNTHQAYKINLDRFDLSVDGAPIDGALQWNSTGTVAAFNTRDVLPPQKQIRFSVQISFQKMTDGSWHAVLQNGQPIIEKQEVTFTTGEAPDYIPPSNVDYSYPVLGQLNFYKDETSVGYIKLKKGQPYLFNPGPDWTQGGRFRDDSGNKSPFDFTYDASSATLNLNIPGSNLKTNQVYSWELVNLPKDQNNAVDRNVNSVLTQANIGGQSLNTEIKTQQAQGSINHLQEKTIFSSNLRSSAYGTFSDKVQSLKISRGNAWTVAIGVDELLFTLTGNELFDMFETGVVNNSQLVQFEGTLDNDWYSNKVNPLVYDDYPYLGLRLRHRSVAVLGVPPVRAISFDNHNDLSLSDPSKGVPSFPSNELIVYNLPLEMNQDYVDLRNQAANLSVSSSNERIAALLTSPFPILTPGKYGVKARYILPGINKVTSEKEIVVDYSLIMLK